MFKTRNTACINTYRNTLHFMHTSMNIDTVMQEFLSLTICFERPLSVNN
jgi:hypothetical protein